MRNRLDNPRLLESARVIATAAILLAGAVACARDNAAPFMLTYRSAKAATPTTSVSKTVTIPAETEVATELLSGIHTQVSHEGDSVTARLSKALYIDGRMALPPGTMLD